MKPQGNVEVRGVDGSSVSQLREGTTVSVDADTNRYENKERGFTLEYPKALAVREFEEEGGGQTVVFQKPGEEIGFQIFIVPYAGTTITEERLKKDLKGASVTDYTNIVIGGNINAAMFWSESPIIGKSREVWFIRSGYLYEVTTYASQDSSLAGILSTLAFK
jgi:hypothetical protein